MKILNKALIVAASLMFAGTAIAHEHGHDRGKDRGGPGMALPAVEKLGKALRRLDLSGDQIEAVRAEFRGMREGVKPLMKQMHQSRQGLRELVTADEYDAEAVAALAAEQGNLTAEITTIASSTVAAVLAQLTDEQRAELEAMGERRRAHREERMQRERRPDPGEG